jgi:hypothetical protein
MGTGVATKPPGARGLKARRRYKVEVSLVFKTLTRRNKGLNKCNGKGEGLHSFRRRISFVPYLSLP